MLKTWKNWFKLLNIVSLLSLGYILYGTSVEEKYKVESSLNILENKAIWLLGLIFIFNVLYLSVGELLEARVGNWVKIVNGIFSGSGPLLIVKLLSGELTYKDEIKLFKSLKVIRKYSNDEKLDYINKLGLNLSNTEKLALAKEESKLSVIKEKALRIVDEKAEAAAAAERERVSLLTLQETEKKAEILKEKIKNYVSGGTSEETMLGQGMEPVKVFLATTAGYVVLGAVAVCLIGVGIYLLKNTFSSQGEVNSNFLSGHNNTQPTLQSIRNVESQMNRIETNTNTELLSLNNKADDLVYITSKQTEVLKEHEKVLESLIPKEGVDGQVVTMGGYELVTSAGLTAALERTIRITKLLVFKIASETLDKEEYLILVEIINVLIGLVSKEKAEALKDIIENLSDLISKGDKQAVSSFLKESRVQIIEILKK